MENKYLLIGLIVIALAIGGYLWYNSGAVVSAQGFGEITAKPDTASIYLNIESRALTAEEAKNNHSLIFDDVLSSLLKLGFERSEIQTMDYQIYPDYDYSYGSSKLKGYVASQQIVVKTDNFDRVSRVVDSAVDAGALIQSINFELSQAKQNEYKIEVLKSASEDARNKAESIALGSGGKLGKLISVANNEFNYYPMPYYQRAGASMTMDVAEAKSAAVNIAPRDLTISASVTAQYKVR